MSGQSQVIDSITVPSNTNYTLSSISSVYALGHSFTGNGDYVTEARFNVRRPSGGSYVGTYVTALVYAHSGTFGTTTAVPTGQPLATSAPKEFIDLPTNSDWVTFSFDGTFKTVAGMHYFIVLSASGVLSSLQLYVYFTTLGSNGGSSVQGTNNYWNALSSKMLFEVLGVSGASYSVVYDGNGNTGGSAPVDSNSPYLDGSIVTVLGSGSLTKTGYTFLGWSASSSATSPTYAVGSTFTISANVLLYAVWGPSGGGGFDGGVIHNPLELKIKFPYLDESLGQLKAWMLAAPQNLPDPECYIRFSDINQTNHYTDIYGTIVSNGVDVAPAAAFNHHIIGRKNLTVLGVLESYEGVVALHGNKLAGWAPTNNPLIWLADAANIGADAFLEIRKTTSSSPLVWGWGGLEAGDIKTHGKIQLVGSLPYNLVGEGKCLILPPGEHDIDHVWDPWVNIVGSGRASTVIKPSASSIGLLAEGVSWCSLRHLTIDLSNITSYGVGLKLLKCQEMLIEDVAFINVPETVTAVQIEGQFISNNNPNDPYDGVAAYETSVNNKLCNVSIVNLSGYFETGIKIIDSLGTKLENIRIRKPKVGIQLECQDILNKGGYSEGTILRDIFIDNPQNYGYRHKNTRANGDMANASFAFTRIEQMAIRLVTSNSVGVYIPGKNADDREIGTCTFDRSVVDQLNIWFSENFNNMIGIRLGCSANQLSVRNLILESFVQLPLNPNSSNGCKGIDIDEDFGGHQIQWLQAPLFEAGAGKGWGSQNNSTKIVDPFGKLDSKCFGFMNKHVKYDGVAAIDRWYADEGVDPGFTVQIEGETGYITARGIKPKDDETGLSEVGTSIAPFESLYVKNATVNNDATVKGKLYASHLERASSSGFIALYNSIEPNGSMINLGSVDRQFENLYVKNVAASNNVTCSGMLYVSHLQRASTSGFIALYNSVEPNGSLINLGSSDRKFNDIFCGGTLYTSHLERAFSSGFIALYNSMEPNGSGINLGSSDRKFNDIFCGGTLYTSHLQRASTTGFIALYNSVEPNGSLINLGSSSREFENLYVKNLHVSGSGGSSAGIQSGTATTNVNGVAAITFSTAFSSNPKIICTVLDSTGRTVNIIKTAQSTTGFSVKTTIADAVAHQHKIGVAFQTDNFNLVLASSSNHSHSAVGTTGVAGGNHNHSINSGGDHTHGITHSNSSMNTGYATAGGTSHFHTYAEYFVSNNVTNSGGGHTHTSSNVNIDHSHSYANYTSSDGGHSHTFSTKPAYARQIALRDVNGGQYSIGVTLETTTKTQTDLFTESGGSDSNGSPVSVSFDWIAIP